MRTAEIQPPEILSNAVPVAFEQQETRNNIERVVGNTIKFSADSVEIAGGTLAYGSGRTVHAIAYIAGKLMRGIMGQAYRTK
jgi:hypothetical protein